MWEGHEAQIGLHQAIVGGKRRGISRQYDKESSGGGKAYGSVSVQPSGLQPSGYMDWEGCREKVLKSHWGALNAWLRY